MKFNSTYDVLKHLVSQNLEFSFESVCFSHGQGADVRVSENIKGIFDAASIGNLEYAIFSLMSDSMADDSLIWLEDFNVQPTLAGDGSLVFDVELYSSGVNFWDTCDPLYEAFICGFPCELECLFEDKYADTSLNLDMLRISLDIEIVGSTFEKLELKIELADERREEINKSEQVRVKNIISEINKSAISTLRAGTEELARQVKGNGILSYSVFMKEKNGYLSEGIIEANYSSCYQAQYSGGCIDHLRTDELVYEVL